MRRGRQENSIGLLLLGSVALAMSCGSDGEYFIRGTARLADCDEAPAATLASRWFDTGLVEVTSVGCGDSQPGDHFSACALNWAITQQDSDVSITVDSEYRIKGRLCGETLSLEGGWWLPVQDETGNCTYDEDNASEVVIQSDGNTLQLTDDPESSATVLAGTLSLGGHCSARYEITLTPSADSR